MVVLPDPPFCDANAKTRKAMSPLNKRPVLKANNAFQHSISQITVYFELTCAPIFLALASSNAGATSPHIILASKAYDPRQKRRNCAAMGEISRSHKQFANALFTMRLLQIAAFHRLKDF